MSIERYSLLVGSLSIVWLLGGEAQASASLTDREITETLSPHGDWVDTQDYGRAWRPRGVQQNWHPYTVGYWEDTADGWLWHSQFTWGAIPFHYGRWVATPLWGWIWVRGYTYAPSWVVWTTDRGQVGWAPLPPNARWQGNAFFGASLASAAWVFCPQSLFQRRVVRFVPTRHRIGRRHRNYFRSYRSHRHPRHRSHNRRWFRPRAQTKKVSINHSRPKQNWSFSSPSRRVRDGSVQGPRDRGPRRDRDGPRKVRPRDGGQRNSWRRPSRGGSGRHSPKVRVRKQQPRRSRSAPRRSSPSKQKRGRSHRHPRSRDRR